MKVKELRDNLAFYDDDAEVIFEIDCDIEPESITETKYGWHTVHLDSRMKPIFICTIYGNCCIEFEVDEGSNKPSGGY